MDCAEREVTIDYSFRGSIPDAINRLTNNPELMDTTYAEGAGPFQVYLKPTKTNDIFKEEEQAQINCERFGYWQNNLKIREDSFFY
ncbi:hypothetical protein CEXT_704091 [Caerostris extrusa]|uniref:Uncharacterized protein n=1 Tax=Caerostris extrusa TaxID=172846 RepID=A0AAV4W340_CAEEX|nr:hypothetical protein CEXT_704091 [Caerostris extrusa]